ncbi:MAG: metallophosphoesterase [Planctomycetaceae bacterium]|nr:metallophosphoesterase [Planctomycetaceae bacterium]
MDWLALLIFAVITLGHTTLWISFVNRSHAWPLHCSQLRHLRHLHDLFIPLFPIILVWRVGLTGPNLLRGGSWANVSPVWWGVFAACAAGFVWLIWVCLRSLLRHPPEYQRSYDSIVYDIGKELGHRPVGRGPYHLLTKVPFNEQTLLEFSRKTLALPRLPEEWDGLTILHISDWHFAGSITRDYYEKVSEILAQEPVDLVCFTGDLIDDQDLVVWFPDTLGQLNGKYGSYFILGNHDWYQRPVETREALERLKWVDVSSRTLVLDIAGKTLELGGDETPWLGTVPEFTSSADFRLLLCHTPDHIPRVRKQDVDLMLSGHNHGGQVQLPVIGPVYSPSKYGVKYASGTFWEPPTLLHVSRGLAGCHPLRWRCKPEATILTLRRMS